jgi:hypothetical protein
LTDSSASVEAEEEELEEDRLVILENLENLLYLDACVVVDA